MIVSIVAALVGGMSYGNSLPPTPDYFECNCANVDYQH